LYLNNYDNLLIGTVRRALAELSADIEGMCSNSANIVWFVGVFMQAMEDVPLLRQVLIIYFIILGTILN
jgi:hypothetical protein